VQAIAREVYERRPITVAGIASAIMADRHQRLQFAGLTQSQAKCLQFIADYQDAHGGIAPSYDEIAQHMGIVSKSGVTRLIDALEDRGRIRRLPGRSRAITKIISTPAS
jgi:repressor LexA